MPHNCSSNCDQESQSRCIQGVTGVWLIHTQFGRSPWEWKGGSGLRCLTQDQWRRIQAASKHTVPFIPVTRVEASCLSFSVSACKSPLIYYSREPWGGWGGEVKSSSLLTLFKWTFDMWMSRTRKLLNFWVKLVLLGHGSCSEGPAPGVCFTPPEPLLCNRAAFMQTLPSPHSTTISAIMSVHRREQTVISSLHVLL